MSLKVLLDDLAGEVLRVWPAEPRFHHRGATDLDRAVPLSLLDRYIDYDLLSPQYVAVVKDGTAVHPGRFSRDSKLVPGRVRDLIDEGHTANLREVQRSIPYLAQITREIERETGYPTYVSAIITPPHCQGLAHHWDQFTGVVAQIAGRKRWPLWKPVVDHPMEDYLSSPRTWTPELQQRLESTAPDAEFELTAGDTLVVPRGWIHSPHAIGSTTSYHLTFALRERPWLWLAQQLVGLAIEELSFRAALPPGGFAGGLEADVRAAQAMTIDFLERLESAAASARIRAAAD
ncbi:JmjC domain-containing protein [Streptomyces pathocidini]|uniref:JmjC domain-containing protein n=1 Tax=Streptomyces pathocidini TaxID=1650571 RepID=A0ABW7UN18_9ACTN|nr:cupin domain-containing protein [Streptomyces pathocidini]